METNASGTSQTGASLPTVTSTRQTWRRGGVWEDDVGLLVLETEGTLFCVRRAVLCLESQIFRDMLSLPQPVTLDVAEQYEGRPLVRLSDSAAELELFLEALHRYRLYYLSPESQTLFARAAILRLSTKYEVPHLRERSIKELSPHFPTTLAEHDEAGEFDPDVELESLAFVASVIEETNVRRFLPALRYSQCRVTPIPLSHTSNIPPALATAIHTLILHQTVLAHVRTSRPCRRSDGIACSAIKDMYFEASLRAPSLHPFFPAPMFDLQYFGNLCVDCASDGRVDFHRKRRELWDKLPSIFGLPPWEELLEEH